MQTKDSSWEQFYQLWPHGVCHRVIENGTPLNPAMWLDLTARIADKWPYSHSGSVICFWYRSFFIIYVCVPFKYIYTTIFFSFDFRSWEKVANDEIWNSK